jgi:isopenicillin-N N-acyltransferase like protein
VHTNHFLRDPGRSGDRLLPEAPHTVLRLELAARRMARLADGEIDEESILEALRSHRGGAGAICCHPDQSAVFGDRWTTLATIVTDPAQGAMRVLRGGPCGHTAHDTPAAATADL